MPCGIHRVAPDLGIFRLAWLEPLLRVATCDFSSLDIDHWKLA